MSESNIQLFKRWFEEVWNQRRIEIAPEFLAEGCVVHLEGGEDAHGLDDLRGFYDRMLAAFPDFQVILEDIISEGSTVVVRWRAKGTHKGAIGGLKATGRCAEFRGTTWVETRDGRVVEAWDSWNLGALLESLKS